MVFSSLNFILWFLPFFIISYFFATNKYKNTVLLIYSLFFYAYGNINTIHYFFLIIISIILNYIFGLLICKYNRFKLIFAIIILIFDFGILFLFKYYDFLIQIINDIFIKNDYSKITKLNLILPIGISFYTFQIASYIIDVYKNKNLCCKNILNLSTYIIMFPQLIAGPIVKYKEIRSELINKKISKQNILNGFYLFAIGLMFKVIIANNLSLIWNRLNMYGFESISTPLAWFGVYSYSMQLYFDFCGYSMMALGLGKIIGFVFPKNFDNPYMSKSLSEFWRNWNITLGNWFKEYVYIPLGGNRYGSFRTFINLLIVWLFTGIWHGANYNFLIWGLSLFFTISIEKFLLKKYIPHYEILGHILVLTIIPFTFIIFAIEDLNNLQIYMKRLFSIDNPIIYKNDIIEVINDYWKIFLIAIIFCTKLPTMLYNKVKNLHFIMLPFSLLIIIFALYLIFVGLNDPFMYFRF